MTMRAIVMTSCPVPGSSSQDGRFVPTRSLVDRPLIQHIVELLAARGIARFEFLLGDEAAAIEATLGDGGRWGVAIRHHLIHDDSRPYSAIRNITEADPNEGFLLVHADHLVEFDPREMVGLGPELFLKDILRLISPDNWTGWAMVRGDDLLSIAEAKTQADLISRWAARCQGRAPADWLPLRDDRELVNAQDALLRGRFRDLIRSGREVEPGVWLSRNVSLHRSAVIVAPVHIAEDCWIGPGVELGPNVAIGAGSVLDEGTRIVDALVMPRTYTGRGLDLIGVVVDRERARFLACGTELDLGDPSMLCEVGGSPVREAIRNLLDRASALVALVTLLPVVAVWYLLNWCRGERPQSAFREVVKIPAGRDPRRWKTFRLWSLCGLDDSEGPRMRDLCGRVWPGLLAVATGSIRLVGQPARSVDDLQGMLRETPDWPRSARAGLISERLVRLEPDATPQERQVADACHAATACLGHDVGLLWGYFARLMRAPCTGTVGVNGTFGRCE